MATTMKLIAKNVLTSNTSSVTFSDIPGTYTDLLLLGSSRHTASAAIADIWISFNGTSDSSHSYRTLRSTGSNVFSNNTTGQGRFANLYVCGDTATSNTFGSLEMYVPNYAGSSNKSASFTTVQEDNSADAWMSAVAGLWANTSAITSIVIRPASGDIKSGSSFFLYGITKSA